METDLIQLEFGLIQNSRVDVLCERDAEGMDGIKRSV